MGNGLVCEVKNVYERKTFGHTVYICEVVLCGLSRSMSCVNPHDEYRTLSLVEELWWPHAQRGSPWSRRQVDAAAHVSTSSVWVHTGDIEVSCCHTVEQNNALAPGDRPGWFWDPRRLTVGPCVWGQGHGSCWRGTVLVLCGPCPARALVLALGSGSGRGSMCLQWAHAGGDTQNQTPLPGSQGNGSLKLKMGSVVIIKGFIVWITSVVEPAGRTSKCKGKLAKS